MNIQDILKNNTIENHHLKDKTLTNISQTIYDVLRPLILPEDLEKTIKKLIGYQYIDEIVHLQKGKYIRWISTAGPYRLTNGGIIIDIKFLDTGTHILCKNNMGKIIQIKIDESIIFQKLSTTEQIIVTANDSLTR
jgi:hypothetical protein